MMTNRVSNIVTPIKKENVLDQLKQNVAEATKSDDPLAVAKMQLEVQYAMLEHLQRIDWKLWELYNKYGA
jgi:hypothetical protein